MDNILFSRVGCIENSEDNPSISESECHLPCFFLHIFCLILFFFPWYEESLLTLQGGNEPLILAHLNLRRVRLVPWELLDLARCLVYPIEIFCSALYLREQLKRRELCMESCFFSHTIFTVYLDTHNAFISQIQRIQIMAYLVLVSKMQSILFVPNVITIISLGIVKLPSPQRLILSASLGSEVLFHLCLPCRQLLFGWS